MRPDQFTMWLRGSLDAVGEGNPIPAEVARVIYDRLTEVVSQQVAEKLKSTWEETARRAEFQLQAERMKMDYELALRKMAYPTYGATSGIYTTSAATGVSDTSITF